jgi:hypothetical protein
MVEAALMMPWLAFLFVGVLDFGFYSVAAICTQNAARAAAIQTANPNLQVNALACQAALGELKWLPNMTGVTAPCPTSPSGITATQPVAVSVTTLTAGTTPACADCGDASAHSPSSAQVTVTYQTVPLVPIPGILMGQMRLTRIAEMRIIQ